MGKLSERLEGVRGVVEGWERSEGEWRIRTRRRLRMLWAGVVGVVGLGVVVGVFWYGPGLGGYRSNSKGETGVMKGMVEKVRSPVDLDVLREREGGGHVNESNETIAVIDSGGGGRSLFEGERGGGEMDDRLRLFDEL